MPRRFLPGFIIALGLLALGLLVAFTVGRYPVTLAELIEVLVSRVAGRPTTVPPAVENVVLLVRGPRVAAAVLVGSALAIAGAAFQGLFRNPLVSPDILGASSGAALGAVLGIFFSLGVLGIEALAFVGGLAAVAAVYVIGSLLHSRDPILVLVLTGVVVGALLGAGVGLVKYLADPYNQLPAMTFWLLGSLAATTVSDLLPLSGPVAVGTIVLIALRWRLNVMSLPEDEARALGLATGPFRIAIVAAATLVTSASVATSGVIGWVGLVVRPSPAIDSQRGLGSIATTRACRSAASCTGCAKRRAASWRKPDAPRTRSWPSLATRRSRKPSATPRISTARSWRARGWRD